MDIADAESSGMAWKREALSFAALIAPKKKGSTACKIDPEATGFDVWSIQGVRVNSPKKLDSLARQIRVCVKCPLHLSRTLAVPGEGKPKARYLIIGEAPGKDEDKTGKPFVGSAGRYLDHVLEGTQIDRSQFFITNIVKCRPPNNRPPKSAEIETCTSNYLVHQVALINPQIVLLLGSVPIKAVLGMKNVEEARGRWIEKDGRRFLATYHPAVRFYREDLAKKLKEDFELLKAALLEDSEVALS